MKKFFSEAEVELTLISALEDILTASVGDADGGNLGEPGDDSWDVS